VQGSGPGDGYSGRFVWRIENFTRLKDLLKKRKITALCIKSRHFQIGNRDCRLIVYPRGMPIPGGAGLPDVATAAGLPDVATGEICWAPCVMWFSGCIYKLADTNLLTSTPAGQSQPPNHLSMFLEVTDPRQGSNDWSCFVSHRLTVVNQKSEDRAVAKESQVCSAVF
jgi:hypothetical protein